MSIVQKAYQVTFQSMNQVDKAVGKTVYNGLLITAGIGSVALLAIAAKRFSGSYLLAGLGAASATVVGMHQISRRENLITGKAVEQEQAPKKPEKTLKENDQKKEKERTFIDVDVGPDQPKEPEPPIQFYKGLAPKLNLKDIRSIRRYVENYLVHKIDRNGEKNYPDDEVMDNSICQYLGTSQYRRILDGKFSDDVILEAYLSYLRSRTKKDCDAIICKVSYSKRLFNEYSLPKANQDFKSLDKWLNAEHIHTEKKVSPQKCQFEKRLVDLNKIKTLYFPINVTNLHWYFFKVDLEKKVAY